ncbi:hypothetical protein [Vulcanisaeta distributa]|uniref:hypothetical protein n=1 Tax=Vulcanisaeta distributa TaxID=164451 RepID=UPI000B0713E7|nr:hypothetical protein [Vulcanisaeta distributa]
MELLRDSRAWDSGGESYGKYETAYVIKSSKAVDSIKQMLSDSSIKALIEDLSTLPDAEKLKNLVTLANVNVRSLGRSSIEVVGIKMSVHVNNNGRIKLRTKCRRLEDATPTKAHGSNKTKTKPLQ